MSEYGNKNKQSMMIENGKKKGLEYQSQYSTPQSERISLHNPKRSKSASTDAGKYKTVLIDKIND